MLTISLLEFSLRASILLLRSLSILITCVLNCVSGGLLVSISFNSFSGVFSCSFFFFFHSWYVFFVVFSLWLLFCVHVYVLCTSATSLSLIRVVLCSRCLVGPRGVVSLITCIRYFRNVPCVECVCSPVVVVFWLLLAHQWMWLIIRLMGYQTWPHQQHMSCWVGADLTECNSHQLASASVETTLGVCHLWG